MIRGAEPVPLAAFLAEIVVDARGLRQPARGVFSALPDDAPTAHYDRRAFLYDAVVGRPLYHRAVWGTSVRAYTRFAHDAVEAAGAGPFAEAGCGSLLFTASLHRAPVGPDTLLVDRSLRMLRRASRRLHAAGARPRGNVALLAADLADVQVRSGALVSILSLNVLHVPSDARAIVRSLGRLLRPETGRLFLTCLVRSGRWSDRWLESLHRLGELATPWRLDQLQHTASEGWGVVESVRLEGNMCFLVIRHAGLAAP